MTPRENVLSLFRRTGYEFAPVGFSMCPTLWDAYKKKAGEVPLEEYFEYDRGFAFAGVPGLGVKDRGAIDWGAYFPGGVKEGTTFNEYGVAHEPGSAAAFHLKYMRHPMAGFDSLSQMQDYPWPELDTGNTAAIARGVEAAHARGRAACGGMECTIWETAWYIRDMTQLMMDMMTDDEKAHFILDRATEDACRRAAAFAGAGVDIIMTGDDIGMQNSIMMSVEMYREWLKPRLAKTIRAAKDVKPDVLIQYHSCGYVEPFIDDLIEAGIDILNPVQPECMDFGELHAKYGDRVSFNGTLGTQTTMPFGSPHDVEAVVTTNLRIAGDKGGLLVSPTHLLEPEVPLANVEAYVRACKEFSPVA
jgi:uroporphyrinogen decarboxylase